MSITVRDCLNLPSFSFGKVVAGKAGLGKIVSSVSVLEFFHFSAPVSFTPNELIISAFNEIRDDVDKQRLAIKRLADAGAVALVLFYVGNIIPRIDESLIKLADKLKLPLIIIDTSDFEVQYSDIISDVMTSVIQDQRFEQDFVSSIEMRIAQLPPELRSMENLLDIISNQYKCSIVLSGSSNIYFQSIYKPAFSLSDPDILYQHFQGDPPGYCHKRVVSNDTVFHLYKLDFLHFDNIHMTLYASCHNTMLSEKILNNICTCAGFFSTVWGYSMNFTSPETLLSLLLKTDGNAASKYLNSVNLSFEQISNLIIILPGKGDITILKNKVISRFKEYEKYYIADIIDNRIVILTKLKLVDSIDFTLFDELKSLVESFDQYATIFMDGGSKNIHILKRSYSDYCKSAIALPKIFINRRHWDLHDVILAQEVTALSESSGRRAEFLSDIISTLKNDQDDLLSTLCVYLIDCNSKLNQTAETLFLHRNTVTYRLNKVKQLTNTNFMLMPAAYDFYIALALWRYQKL